MSTKSQPFYAACDGGLVLNSNNFELLGLPGVATKLRNFEVSLYGGYRRVNGFYPWGEGGAVQPSGAADNILGVFPYAGGNVVVVDDAVYYTEDGVTYIQVNIDTTEVGMTAAELLSGVVLPRTNQQKAHFVLVRGEAGHSGNVYGVLYIATKTGKLGHFHIEGDGVGRKYVYTEVDGIGAPAEAGLIENHDHHLCVVDTSNLPGTLYYSHTNDFDDFNSAGAGSATVLDGIVGIKSFRQDLIIFCHSSIYKLLDINDPTNVRIVPVTNNLGCVDGFTIQEINGDLVFLSTDGLRSYAATERLNDVELGPISRGIQPLMDEFTSNNSLYIFSSVVIRSKNQYRLFTVNGAGATKGVVGTLRTNPNGNTSWQWAELRGFPVYSISSYFNQGGEEVVYHGGTDGYVHVHDKGNSFNGDPIASQFETPDISLGDLGMRHTLHYMNLSITTEGASNLFTITPRFNFGSAQTLQPSPITVNVQSSVGAIIGEMIIGSFTFASSSEGTIRRIPMVGSGGTVRFSFVSSDTDAPYTIHGYHLEAFPSGRK